ncbi:MAG: hypothetical protein KC729_16305, partial [Candidatus Eisenbacteria bacterium]|nr:hypothetical protein [Candidatus Eisenbacteria bacterium]
IVIADGDTVGLGSAGQIFRCAGLDLRFTDGSTGPETVRVARARFLRTELALAPGLYEAEARLLGDSETTSPIEISAFGEPGIASPRIEDGASEVIRFRFRVADTASGDASPARTSLLWKPRPGERVALAYLRVERVETGTSDEPAPDPLESGRDQLRRIADYLVAYQVPEFANFDYTSTAWWEASMAVRTLLAAAEILDEDAYRDAARRTVDVFRARQWEDGDFCSYIEGMPNPAAQTRKLSTCDTHNRADLGSITACLSLLAVALPESSRTPYLTAHRRYLESRILGQAMSDGCFSNGRFEGRDYGTCYSVATGTSALTLAAYATATGDADVRRAAEEAARFLAGTFTESGTILFHHHDRAEPEEIDASWFHNVYYVLEGLIAVAHVTDDASVQRAIADALRRYVHGPEGLAAFLPADGWISVGSRRQQGKANGMLGLLVEIRALLGPDPTLDGWIAAGTQALCDPQECGRYAVLLPPFQASADKAEVCTSFAGLSIAESLRPGILFMRP